MGISVPSRPTIYTGSPSPRTTLSLSTRVATVSTSQPLSGSTIRRTSSISRPLASCCCQPVSDWAIEFMKVMRPRASVVITASPMLFKVMLSCFSASSAASSAWRRAIVSELTNTAPIMNVVSLSRSSAPSDRDPAR